jgi:hypothetical protein
MILAGLTQELVAFPWAGQLTSIIEVFDSG